MDNIKVLISEEKLQKRIKKLAKEIEKDYKDNLRSNVFKAKMISLFGKDK